MIIELSDEFVDMDDDMGLSDGSDDEDIEGEDFSNGGIELESGEVGGFFGFFFGKFEFKEFESC